MDRLNPNSRKDAFGSKINRTHLPVLAYGVPWLSILLGSLAPLLPVIAPAPVVPPFAFIMLVAWQLVRPGILPLWAGLPLGLFDDLYSGQPIGSAVVLFSCALLATDLFEGRFPYRNFLLNWFNAAVLITIYVTLGTVFSGAKLTILQMTVMLPLIFLSIAVFPLAAWLVAMLDRLRLMRLRRVG